jgi:hypothetical protein
LVIRTIAYSCPGRRNIGGSRSIKGTYEFYKNNILIGSGIAGFNVPGGHYLPHDVSPYLAGFGFSVSGFTTGDTLKIIYSDYMSNLWAYPNEVIGGYDYSGTGTTCPNATTDASNNNRTLFSNCDPSSLTTGCTVYYDINPQTTLTGTNFAYMYGSCKTLNTLTGIIT